VSQKIKEIHVSKNKMVLFKFLHEFKSLESLIKWYQHPTLESLIYFKMISDVIEVCGLWSISLDSCITEAQHNGDDDG
jgi:hypothetical protein